MARLLDELPLSLAVIMALTLGLAPFTPEPHVWEKLKMLGAGDLRRGVDIFDLCLHGAPWGLLMVKIARMVLRPGR